ncbi:MAG: hypothetical protein PW789_04740 [Edaphobacter sp.]|nr:hypothetical protein [Edaphobacter sp.]MDE1175894.1 hypothetical protein [Edaphobacter sp.]
MEATGNTMHFLWAAYVVVVVANVGFAVWLWGRWAALEREKRKG